LQVAQLTPTRQLLPEQQPLGQLVALHTQVALAPLPLHIVPDGHAAPVEPQTHLAEASQTLVLLVAQVTQAVPGAPHEVALSAVQVEPLQQPLGHKVALQPEQTPSGLGAWPQLAFAPQLAQVEPL
jgi:hypothetical protein